MLHVINTIIPIFAIIFLGWALCSRQYLPSSLTEPLNKIVFYLALPAMIFEKVAGAHFQAHFNFALLIGTLIPPIAVFFLAIGIARLIGISRHHTGTFLQSSFHGNLGYVALAVAFYFLGTEGFTTASILAGFLMLLQNFLSVFALEKFGSGTEDGGSPWFFLKKILGNPVILSAVLGILFSVFEIPIPQILVRSLKILSDMALPSALLIIGARLSLDLIKSQYRLVIGAGFLKLLVLPGFGLLLYQWFGIPPTQFMPGLILLAAPTATVTYIMAGEMGGSTSLASAAVSANTLLSSLTFIFWLSLFTQVR